jgi:hypothetical protein
MADHQGEDSEGVRGNHLDNDSCNTRKVVTTHNSQHLPVFTHLLTRREPLVVVLVIWTNVFWDLITNFKIDTAGRPTARKNSFTIKVILHRYHRSISQV